jgi:hypothetical protein
MAREKKSKNEEAMRSEMSPDKLPVTKKRATYLANLIGVDAKEFKDKSVAQANDLLKWKVDPELLLFRRVCGKVVKRDPVTGALCLVPGATVHVEDTDCRLLGYFPIEGPYFWLLPISCDREVIATVTTDACGEFCVYLPYWDIDRILRIRRSRICFGDIFKPRLKDIFELLPDPPIIRWPWPLPDPPPIDLICPEVIEHVRAHFDADTADILKAMVEFPELGAPAEAYTNLLDAPLPSSPPPLPSKLIGNPEINFEAIAAEVGLDEKAVRKLDFSRFIGPFLRCRDIWVAEWVTFFDIPDITFRVTQDVDADGIEEEIYSEGFFDVRWNAGPFFTVTLEADASAICVPICEPVDPIPCEDVPVINTAGYMPLLNTHHNDATGYGRRVNRPVPAPGDYPPPPSTGSGPANAVSPYGGTLNLHGCHRIGDATHYRFTKVLNGVGSPTPITGVSWWTPRSAASPGPPIHVVPDPDGWYPILDAAIIEHPSWLLYWNTRNFANGTYELRLEVGKLVGGTMTASATSDPRKFTTDNKRPEASFLAIRWRYANVIGPWTTANSTLLPAICPVIHRDPAQALRIQVEWRATADHLRNAGITFSGCGGVSPVLVEPTPAAPDIEAYRHWHTGQFDNTVLQINEFEIPAGAEPGCYTLYLNAISRAFNPSGFDSGPAYDWLINQSWLWRWTSRAISIADI